MTEPRDLVKEMRAQIKPGATEATLRECKATLVAYRDRIRNDLVTKYDDDPRYCTEDDMFLGGELARASELLFRLEDEFGI